MDVGELWGRLQRELLPGERLLWWGQPRQGFMLRSGDWFVIPFSVMWCGFAIFFQISLIAGAPSSAGVAQRILVALFGLPFVVVGLWLLLGRYVIDRRRRAQTLYAVSDRRALVLSKRQTRTWELRQLPALEYEELRDGRGSIWFDPPPGRTYVGYVRAGFDSVADGRQVYDTLRHSYGSARHQT